MENPKTSLLELSAFMSSIQLILRLTVKLELLLDGVIHRRMPMITLALRFFMIKTILSSNTFVRTVTALEVIPPRTMSVQVAIIQVNGLMANIMSQ